MSDEELIEHIEALVKDGKWKPEAAWTVIDALPRLLVQARLGLRFRTDATLGILIDPPTGTFKYAPTDSFRYVWQLSATDEEVAAAQQDRPIQNDKAIG